MALLYMKKILLLLFLAQSCFCFADKTRITCANPKNFAYSKMAYLSKYYIELDFLLMNLFEDGLEYALILKDKNDHSQSNQKFNPGSRLTFGYSLLKYNSSLELLWTYIKMKRSSHTGVRDIIYNLFLPPQFITGTKASASLSGNFNTFDLNFLKPYKVSNYYISNPTIGIRGALIDQNLKVIYTISNTLNAISAKNDYWGIGLLAGYEANFIIVKYCNFYAKTDFSLLCGKTSVSQSSNTPLTSLLQYDLKTKIYSVLPNAEICFGLNLIRLYRHKTLSVKVGYEFHHFWGQNNLRKFMANDPIAAKRVSRNDLKFNGLNFSLSLCI